MKRTISFGFESPDDMDPAEIEVVERKVRELVAGEMQRLDGQAKRALPPLYALDEKAAVKI